ncbi:MAG: hypothetical protein P4N60_11120 [Verrucomicrobiae bacterium]|nr:hypothetical protein [Verrucomicrobiae bacterium]
MSKFKTTSRHETEIASEAIPHSEGQGNPHAERVLTTDVRPGAPRLVHHTVSLADETQEVVQRSVLAGRLMDRWLRIQLELFTPDLAPERRQRIHAILDRIMARHDAVTPYAKMHPRVPRLSGIPATLELERGTWDSSKLAGGTVRAGLATTLQEATSNAQNART